MIALLAFAALQDGPATRVLLVGGDPALPPSMRSLGFEVRLVQWADVASFDLSDADVVYLPSCWANTPEQLAAAEEQAGRLRAFVERGGGLVAGQANAFLLPDRTVTPGLLPYPITFYCRYDDDRRLENLSHDHFITEDVAPEDLPFPADTLTHVDERYAVLARQAKTGNVALAVCAFGDGRVVVHTAAEGPRASVLLSDEVLRRMVVWAAGRD